MSTYSEFFLNTRPDVVQLDLVEISHPNFTQTYNIVRNAVAGVSVTHEGPAGPFDYQYVPMRLVPLSASTDMDQEIEITLGDVGEIMQQELDAVSDANGFQTKPTVVYRTYRHDDLSAPLFGPVTLTVNGMTLTREGSVFRAQAASFNLSRTGATYRVERFPMLEGVV
jgi:hypothetical protein